MVVQESPPSLGSGLSVLGHHSGNRPLGNLDSQLEQFPVNARCAPKRIGSSHLQDQRSNLGIGFWTSALPPANPGPVEAKALAMPGHDSLWPYDYQRSVPILPTPGQPHPKQAIRPSQPRPGAPSLEHCELLTKGQVLQGDISEVKRRNENTQQQTKEGEHGVQGEGQQLQKSIIFGLT
jgi:hypothetical protein